MTQTPGTEAAEGTTDRAAIVAQAAAIAGSMWLAAVVNDWLLNQLVPLLQLGLNDPVPFVVGRYAWSLVLSVAVAALGWWYARPDIRHQVWWVVGRVLASTGWLLLGLVVARFVAELLSSGLSPMLHTGPDPAQGPVGHVLPLVAAGLLIVLGLVVTRRGPDDRQDPIGAPALRVAGLGLLGASWTAWVTYQLLLFVVLPLMRDDLLTDTGAVVQLLLQLGLALVVTVVAFVISTRRQEEGSRVGHVTSGVMQTVGWALVGASVYQVVWLVTTFGRDGLRDAGGLGPWGYLIPLATGLVLGIVGVLAARPRATSGSTV